MHLELTREQYRDLLDLLYLGDWMVNAIRDPGEEVWKYRDLEQYVLSFAEEQDFGNLVEYDPKFQRYFHTREFEETELDTYRQEYDEENFWEELVYRLARRDLLYRYGEEAVRRMELPELLEREQPFLDTYEDETENHGIDRLKIVDDSGESGDDARG